MKRLVTLAFCLMMCFSVATPTTALAKCSHKNTTWVTTSKSTCRVMGTKVKKCKSCGKILKTEKIAKTSHKYKVISIVDPDCESPGLIQEMCQKCKFMKVTTISKPLGHNWTKWHKNVISGNYERKCKRCGCRSVK